MKKIVFVVLLLHFFSGITAQTTAIKPLQWWKDAQLLGSFPNDLNRLHASINEASNSIAIQLKNEFDANRIVNDTVKKAVLYRHIKEVYLPAFERNIYALQHHSFYTDSLQVGQDSSFLFYYTNKELKDYINAIRSLSTEALLLMDSTDQYSMSEFRNGSFLSAYYNYSMSRSLLLAAVNNLLRYYLLGNVADNIEMGNKHMQDTLQNVQQLLQQPFTPYMQYRNQSAPVPTDKITGAGNAVLKDNRRNWWWRSLVTGLTAGLIAGFILRK